MAYCLGKPKDRNEVEIYAPIRVTSRKESTSSIQSSTEKPEVKTVKAEVHAPSSPTPEQDPPLEPPLTSRSSSRSNIQSLASSRQTLPDNVDEILSVPKEKNRWFKLSGKRKKNKTKEFKEPPPKPPPKSSKGKIPKNFEQDLQRSSGEALRSYNEAMDKLLAVKDLSEYQVRKVHDEHMKKILRRYTDEFHQQLQSRNQDIVAMIIEENAKLEKDITTLFEQRLKQYQQHEGVFKEALDQSGGRSLNDLSPDPVSPAVSTASVRTRSDNQSPASSRHSLDDLERSSSVKDRSRWSFIRVGSKSKLKEKSRPSSPRSTSPSPSRAEVEAIAQQELQKLNKAVLQKSEEALRAYKLSMDAFVALRKDLTDDQIRTVHATSRKTILGKFSEDFQEYFTSRNRSAVTTVQNARSNLESDMNARLAPYLQKHQEQISREQAKVIITQAEYFYQKEMLNFQPSKRTEREVRIKHMDTVKASLDYFDSLVKKQGWVVPSTWRNEIQANLDDKLEEILQQLKLEEDDIPKEEVSSPAPHGIAAQMITNLQRVPEVPAPKTKSINVGIYLDQSTILAGTINPNNVREPEIIKSVQPCLTFKDEIIEIGGSEDTENENSFDVCELILSEASDTFSIKLKSTKVALTTEEIITVFFQQILNEVKAKKKADFVSTVVVSVPFVITSLEKERIQEALKAAGAEQVRVLSSLITTAIAYAQETGYYANPNDTKLVFATHSLKKSFSMALVEITPSSIITKRSIGSQNMKEGLTTTFHNCHRHLYTNGRLKPEQQSFVRKTYAVAIKQLFQETRADALIEIRNTPGDNLLSRILSSILGENPQAKLIIQAPFVGACLLAGKGSIPSSIIPADLEVYDGSRSDLQLVTKSNKILVPHKNRVYRPGTVFKSPVIVTPEGSTVILKEAYFKDKFDPIVGRHFLSVLSSVKHCQVELRCMMDQDGVLKVEADMSKDVKEGSLQRLDHVAINSKPRSGLDQIYGYYYPQGLREAKDTYEERLVDDSPMSNGNKLNDEKAPEMKQPVAPVEIKKEEPPKQNKLVQEPKASLQKLPSPQRQEPVLITPQEAFTEKEQFPKPKSSSETDSTESDDSDNSNKSKSSSDVPTAPPPKIPIPAIEPAISSEEIIKEIQKTLEKAVKDGIENHKELMASVTDSTAPYTDGQLKEFHYANLKAVVSSFNGFVSHLTQYPRAATATVEAKEKLIKEIELLFTHYLTKYETTQTELRKKIKRWELEGECYYDDEMEHFQPKTKLAHQLKSEHKLLKADVLNEFAGNVRAEGLEWQDFWKAELEWRLERKLEEALDDCLPEPAPVIVAPPTPTIQAPVVPVAATRGSLKELNLIPKDEPEVVIREFIKQEPEASEKEASKEHSKLKEQLLPKEASKELANEEPEVKTKDVPKEEPEVKAKDVPKEEPKVAAKQKEESKVPIKQIPKEETKVITKPKEEPKILTLEMPKEEPKVVTKQLPVEDIKVVSKPVATEESKELSQHIPKVEPQVIQKPIPKFEPRVISVDKKPPEVKAPEANPTPSQPFQYRTPAAFVRPLFTLQTYSDRDHSKPVITSPGFTPAAPLVNRSPKEEPALPEIKKEKVPELPKVGSSVEKKKLSLESNQPFTTAGATPSTPRKSPLTTVYNFSQEDLSKPEIKTDAPQKTRPTVIEAIVHSFADKEGSREALKEEDLSQKPVVKESAAKATEKILPSNAKRSSPTPKQEDTKQKTSTKEPIAKVPGKILPSNAKPSSPTPKKVDTSQKPAVKEPIANGTTKVLPSNGKPSSPKQGVTSQKLPMKEPGVKVTGKILPTNGKSSSPVKESIAQRKGRLPSGSSTDSSSPRQPSGYTYSYNFRDPKVKPTKAPLASEAFTSPKTQIPERTSRSSSSSSDDSRKGKKSPSKIPLLTSSRLSPPKAKRDLEVTPALPTSQPPKSAVAGKPSVPNTSKASENPKTVLPTKPGTIVPKSAFVAVPPTITKPTAPANASVPPPTGYSSSKNLDPILNQIIKSSKNPSGKLTIISDIEKDQLELIQDTLKKASNESTKFHFNSMQALVNLKHPFTEKQLVAYHSHHLITIQAAWDNTFDTLRSPNIPNMSDAVNASEAKLLKLINSQLATSLLQYNTVMEKVSKTIKELTIEASNQYDECMEEFKPPRRSRKEVESEHSRVKEEVTTIFKERVIEAGINWDDAFKSELDETLEEKLNEFLEDYGADAADGGIADPDGAIRYIDSSSSESGSIEVPVRETGAPAFQEELVTRPMETQAFPSESEAQAYPLQTEIAALPEARPEPIYQNIPFHRRSIEYPAQALNLQQPRPVSVADPISNEQETQSMKIFHSILKKNGAPSPSRRVNFGFPSSSQSNLNEPSQPSHRPAHTMSTLHFDNQQLVNPVPQKASRTKSLPDLDSNRAAGQFIANSVKRPAGAPPPVPVPLKRNNERINVGIYLDEHFANVGTFLNNDVNEVDLLLQIPAEIAFLDDAVVVGWQAEKNRDSPNHFYVYQLIKIKVSEVHPIQFKTFRHTPCTEEIIAIYFKKLHEDISLVKRGSPVGNVIITVPFTLTSAEKERIKTATKIAGLQNVRVMSSLVTMAVAHARESRFYLTERPAPKTILVVHYLKHSFSMAILEINQYSITTRSCYGSENMTEGQQIPFLKSHALLFGNGKTNQKEDFFILNIYKRALHQLSSACPTPWDRILIVKQQDTTKLDKVMDNLFGKQNQARGYLDGPLLGACLLACKSQLNIPIIPNNLEVHDASRSHLVLQSSTGQVWRRHFRNHIFRPEIVFRFPLSVPPAGAVVVLEEEFIQDEEPKRVGQYQVIARRENNRSSDVFLNCSVDEDGVFTLSVDYTQDVIEGYVVRSDQLFVTASDHRNPVSGFGKLTEHYQQYRGTLV